MGGGEGEGKKGEGEQKGFSDETFRVYYIVFYVTYFIIRRGYIS